MIASFASSLSISDRTTTSIPIAKGIPLAMGIDVVVLSLIDKLEAKDAIIMLGIGLACMAITQFPKKD